MIRTLFCLTLLLLPACAFVNVDTSRKVRPLEETVVEGKGKAKIAVVEISGILRLGSFGLDGLTGQPPELARFREALRLAREDENVKALVVRIDSPGGSVTASDIYYHEIRSFGRETGRPVVACVMDRALSGGYYAALGADLIVAHPTSIVGGVGVIAYDLDLSGLLEHWGVGVETVKSGEEKDFWSPLRPAGREEQAVMQGITGRMHGRFVDLVQKSRYLKPCVLKQVAKGGVFDALPARDLGLIDQVGYLDDALALARELAGVAEARTIIYRPPGGYGGSAYAAGGSLPLYLIDLERRAEELLGPGFRYQVVP